MRFNRQTSRGFTLIEVLVALTILGLGVVTLLQIFSLGLRLDARSAVRTNAADGARDINRCGTAVDERCRRQRPVASSSSNRPRAIVLGFSEDLGAEGGRARVIPVGWPAGATYRPEDLSSWQEN
jgi:prepilin-type N-terminal cleavage/methylation domain-containing protein